MTIKATRAAHTDPQYPGLDKLNKWWGGVVNSDQDNDADDYTVSVGDTVVASVQHKDADRPRNRA